MADDKKFFDVSRPGRSAPDATARPVIVANRSMVKDPTLKHAEDQPQPPVVKTQAKSVNPTEGFVNEPKTDAETETSRPEEVDAPDGQIEQSRVEQEKLNADLHADEERKKQAEQLIKSGKYVVPVGHIKRNRKIRRTLLALLLAVLLVIIASDLLIDAGMIKTDIKPVVDLIKN